MPEGMDPITWEGLIAAAAFVAVMACAWIAARLYGRWRWGRKRTYYVRRRRL